jgi:hypothetical protein
MRLIYVNEIGSDYKGQKQYEFIFSEGIEIDMEEWFDVPASSTMTLKSPSVEYIDLVGLLKDTDLVLELIQNSDFFGMYDSVDGVIALGWEKPDNYEGKRLVFQYGESIEIVENKLYEKDIVLKWEKNLVSDETYES